MTADDVVTASLAALTHDEVVCVPALADSTLFDRLTVAQFKVFRDAVMQTALAERDRSPTRTGER